MGSYYYCVRGTRTQPLICVGCPVQLIREVFLKLDFEIAFEELAYVLPHFHALAHVVILVSSAFIFQRFAEVLYSVFVKRSCFKKFAESS